MPNPPRAIRTDDSRPPVNADRPAHDAPWNNKSFECPFDDLPIDFGELSPHALARVIAGRLEQLGYEPFASDRKRYAVILEENRLGEIVDLGKPLKGQRFFPTKSLSRNIETLRQFKSFAQEQDTQDWRFWSIGKTGCKANPATLVEDLKGFNDRINVVFSDCRKHHRFEPLLVVIHIRYDHWSQKFDLHSHFVCQIPADKRETVARKLTCAFSKSFVPDEPIENLAAVATYCLWGIYRLSEMIDWPKSALSAVWKLSQNKPRLFRACRAFAKWRRTHKVERTEAEKAATRRRRKNRLETRSKRKQAPTGDRILAKANIRLRGERVTALIVEEGTHHNNANATAVLDTLLTYPSATSATTQERQNEAGTVQTLDVRPGRAGDAGGAPNTTGTPDYPLMARAIQIAGSVWWGIKKLQRVIGHFIRNWRCRR